MKNKILNTLKRQWLLVWMIVAVLVVSGFTVYASYELADSHSKMKRVVSATLDSGMMFSSNYLVENGNTTYAAKYVTDSNGASTYDISVYLWNYGLKNPSKRYPIDIDYTLTATLTNQSGTALTEAEATSKLGNKVIHILNENNQEVVALSKTNRAGTVNQSLTTSETDDKYVIRYPTDWDLDDSDVCVQLIATPNNGGDTTKYKDLKPISGVLGLKESVEIGTQGWTVYINEQKAGKSIDGCAAYNVVASGSGQSTIKILWDPTKLDFNEYFFSNTKSVYSFGTGEVSYTKSLAADDATDPGHAGWSRIIIAANASSSSNGYRNRYDIQLYKVGGYDPSGWQELSAYLIMSAN